jgi:hypothetical protein
MHDASMSKHEWKGKELSERDTEAILHPAILGGRIRTTASSRRQRAEYEELLMMRGEDDAGRAVNGYWREERLLAKIARERTEKRTDRRVAVSDCWCCWCCWCCCCWC